MLSVLITSLPLCGQDIQYSQVYSNPLYLNPAFAGTAYASRVMLNHRNQWPGIEHQYLAYGAAVDHYIKQVNGGVGISFVKDIAGTHSLSNTLASVIYSQQINLTRKATLALGVKGSAGQRAFDNSRLLFADQVIRESATSLSTPYLAESFAYADISSGILYYRSKMWIGASAHHLNEPNQSLTGSFAEIPVKYSVHGGAEIPVKAFEKSLGAKKLRVAFNYKSQGEWNQLDIGGYFTMYNINFGTWYRGIPMKPYKAGYQNNESVVLLLGYETPKHWLVGYSYDITISRLAGYSGGAHEIAIIYEYHGRKKQKRRIVPCAKF